MGKRKRNRPWKFGDSSEKEGEEEGAAAAASINCNAARRQFKRRLFCAASANLQGGIPDHQNMNCLLLSPADIDNRSVLLQISKGIDAWVGN